MKDRIVKYLTPALSLLGTVGVVVCGTWFGWWQSNFFQATANASGKPFIQILAEHWLNWREPILWFGVSILLLIVGTFDSFRNRTRRTEIVLLGDKFRKEKNAHQDTQFAFYQTLKKVLDAILAEKFEPFDNTCRVTIYRKMKDNDTTLKQIFRFSSEERYKGGRLKIPNSEGIVGAAWQNHGEKEFNHTSGCATANYRTALERTLVASGASCPATNLSMPSQSFCALAINGHQNDEKEAIIVFESTTAGKFKLKDVKPLFESDHRLISRLILPLWRLDTMFNPDTDDGET